MLTHGVVTTPLQLLNRLSMQVSCYNLEKLLVKASGQLIEADFHVLMRFVVIGHV